MQMCEIACTAPLVIGYRTARMLTGGWPPSARDRREYTRMWQEKVEAFTQAAMAAATSAPGPVAAGARQRPAAVPRVSGPRARPAASQRAIAPVRGSAGPGHDPKDPRRSA